jgi:hypothetical protein
MSNQIVISSGAKVRELEGVLTGTSGVVNALGINVPSGIPQLDGSGKILVSQLPNSVMEYKGSWNAATNTPTLVNGTGNAGDVYLCEVAGTVNFGAGPIAFFVGDQVIYSGAIWQRASGATGTVTSVAVTESGDALTITGSPITTSGTINIGFAGTSGQYINGAGDLTTFPSLTGFVPYTGATADVDLGIYGLSANLVTPKQIILKKDTILGGAISIETGSGFAWGGSNDTILLASGASNTLSLRSIVSSVLRTAILDFSTISAAASRTITLPDLSGTLALLEGNQELSGYKTFTGGAQFTGTAGTYTDYGIAFTKGSTPTPFSSGTTNLYSDVTTNNIVIRDTSSNAKLVFNNSTQTYTYPALSGTMALLEGTQTFSGSKTFSATTLLNTIYIDGVSYLKHQTTTSYIAGYTTYSAKANGVIEYFFPSSFKSVLDFNDAADYTYTFPAADGTLALTSDLGGYVPYTGATANVNLGTFDLTADVITGATGSFASSGGSDTFAINHSSGSGIALNITKGGNGEGLYINKTSGSGNAATIVGNLGGTSATFSSTLGVTGALSGTSATFSSTLTATDAVLTKNGDITIKFNPNNVAKWDLYYNNADGTIGFYDRVGSAFRMTLAQTGAATFSNDVTIGGNLFLQDDVKALVFGSGTTSYIIGSSTNNNIRFITSATERLRITSGGNVGIGTSSPDTALQAIGGISARTNTTGDAFYRLYLDSSIVGHWYADRAGSKLNIGSVTSIPLVLETGGSERMRITSGGNVLIGGTTDAGYKLDVNGTVRVQGSNPAFRTDNTTSYTSLVSYLSGTRSWQLDNVSNDFKLYIAASLNTYVFNIAASTGAATFSNLAGTGSRAVLADSSGTLSAPVSDISVKQNITSIGYGLSEILKMNPVWFDFIDEYKNYGEGRQNGMIAQEVAEVIPEAVFTTPSTGKMGINYDQMHAVYIKAIQELKTEIEELKALLNK